MTQTLPERRSGASERAQPLSELDQLSDRMRRLLDDAFGGLTRPSLLREAAAWAPLVDIEEQDDAYVLEAELPGVDRDDVNIEVAGNELTITGELKERERMGILRRKARRTGRFYYRVLLPEQVDPEQIDAKLDGGVLTVRVPKTVQAQRRRIEVKAS